MKQLLEMSGMLTVLIGIVVALIGIVVLIASECSWQLTAAGYVRGYSVWRCLVGLRCGTDCVPEKPTISMTLGLTSRAATHGYVWQFEQKYAVLPPSFSVASGISQRGQNEPGFRCSCILSS